ncbi:glycosyl transferase [Paenibacillus tarimensis]|uniref:glycosyl transferase n=1 Tax=Paenibacillus tarimensis TaxID=416012 RepID=UPI001F16A06E|nr:glycosyl transferase [Paenibacillus tarimensis]MCF2944585.1 glycosyl transferase [Paenibacillus tarimensis]
METAKASIRHLRRMTDDTGLIEHALGLLPRRKEGYTTDDNARALWACVEWMKLSSGKADEWDELADTYLAFLLWMQREDGSFHNNVAYDRQLEQEEPSDDCFGRTVWAAASAWLGLPDDDRRIAAESLLTRSAQQVENLKFPRGWAYTLAAYSAIMRDPLRQPVQGSRADWEQQLRLRERVEWLESRLLDQYKRHAVKGWSWFEPSMTYGNGVLPWSLFMSYQVTGSEEARRAARESLDMLRKIMTAPEGWIRPVGNEAWATADHVSQWDQQPLEVMKLALAAKEAYLVEWKREDADTVRRCREWFHGSNDCSVRLADMDEGSCCDGLTRGGPNRNKGAESTLSYLLTEAFYNETVFLTQEREAQLYSG